MSIEPRLLLGEVFPGVDEDTLIEMSQYARINTYSAGTVLCTEGAEESVFYVIAAGSVEVSKRFVGSTEEHVLRTSHVGDFFGEMALIADTPRNASVRTLEETTVLEIDKPLFVEMLRHSPIVALTMFRVSVERLRANDRMAMRKLSEQKAQIEHAYAELSAQERRRTDFLSTLSHELRTPLTSASGFMQLVKSGNVSSPVMAMALEKINAGLEQTVSLVNDLLFVQEMDLIAPAIKPVDLPSIIERLLEDTEEAAADNSVQVMVDLPESLPVVQADPDGLARALRALLDNAIKFSPDGGNVHVSVSVDASRLNIAISDPGIGIEPEFLPRIFQRFEHRDSYGDHLFGGIGLGLPIAKHLIESFGGIISVQTEAGNGSTFTVHLPVLMGQPETS